MKHYIGMGIVLALFMTVRVCVADYTPPTPAQIASLVSAPAGIAGAIQGATPQQAADVLVKAIEAVEASTLDADGKKQIIARLVAYAVAKMGSRAPGMMAFVVVNIAEDRIPLVVAAAMVAAPDYRIAIRQAILDALGAETGKGVLADAAAKDPLAVLGDLLMQIVSAISRGSAVSAHQADLHDLVPTAPPPPYQQ